MNDSSLMQFVDNKYGDFLRKMIYDILLSEMNYHNIQFNYEGNSSIILCLNKDKKEDVNNLNNNVDNVNKIKRKLESYLNEINQYPDFFHCPAVQVKEMLKDILIEIWKCNN